MSVISCLFVILHHAGFIMLHLQVINRKSPVTILVFLIPNTSYSEYEVNNKDMQNPDNV